MEKTRTENVTSKGISFARRLLQWFEENEISKKGHLNLLTLMHNAFGRTLNLPVKSTLSETYASLKRRRNFSWLGKNI